MQKLLYDYRGVILILFVLIIGFSLMSINVRKLETIDTNKQINMKSNVLVE